MAYEISRDIHHIGTLTLCYCLGMLSVCSNRKQINNDNDWTNPFVLLFLSEKCHMENSDMLLELTI
ncbi:hypothetical protein BpHYR1_009273 [Brachionus plicatilis]|uniref:Uncharacterized protein n=1 Tax=Brachionus plicatilis TaxID=10195 RepID=A0A3M7Q7I6_BRAPC|nr:hypothetical protein BpHYR1_009273 [Brachionus plicatilis]